MSHEPWANGNATADDDDTVPRQVPSDHSTFSASSVTGIVKASPDCEATAIRPAPVPPPVAAPQAHAFPPALAASAAHPPPASTSGWSPPDGGTGLPATEASPTLSWPTASFGRRAGAWIVDVVFTQALGIVLAVAVYFVVMAMASGADGAASQGNLLGGLIVVALLWSLLVPIFDVLWIVCILAGGRTRTPGQAVFGIKVVRNDGALKIGFGKSLGRSIVRAFLSPFLLLGYLSMLWDPERRTWHDRASGTRVVCVPKGLPLAAWGPWLGSWALRTTGIMALLLLAPTFGSSLETSLSTTSPQRDRSSGASSYGSGSTTYGSGSTTSGADYPSYGSAASDSGTSNPSEGSSSYGSGVSTTSSGLSTNGFGSNGPAGQRSPSTTTASRSTSTTRSVATTTTTSQPTQTVDEQNVRRALDKRVQGDERTVDDVIERWLPQLASTPDGSAGPANLAPFQKNLREFDASYEEVILVQSSDYTSFRLGAHYVALVAEPFPTSEGALKWCRDHGRSVPDSCFAKIVSRRLDPEEATSTV